MRDLGSIGDTVSISVTKDGCKFSCSGDIGTANMTIRHSATADSAENNIIIELKEPVALTFALRYLNNFAKATPLASSVQMAIIKDAPIKVSYAISDFGSVNYYLAPKIDDDQEMEAES